MNTDSNNKLIFPVLHLIIYLQILSHFTGRIPLKLEKNTIFWRKIVIFHTKYPKHFSVLLRYTDSDCPFGIFKLFLYFPAVLPSWNKVITYLLTTYLLTNVAKLYNIIIIIIFIANKTLVGKAIQYNTTLQNIYTWTT
jgi:hypothetical protein